MNIKKRIFSIVAASAVTSATIFAFPGCALGRDISVVLNGTELTFSVKPELVDGTVLVPLRDICEELGMTVSWNGGNSTATAVKNGKSAIVTVGSTSATINGEAVELAAAPVLENGTVLVPLRVIGEAAGMEVEWNDYTVTLTKESSEADDDWKNNTGTINLDDMTVSGDGVSVDGKTIKITSGGDFTVSGTCADGMIYVNTEERVKLRLNGISLTNTDGPAIFFENSDKGFITLVDGTENIVSDGEEYSVDAKGAIFSNDDLEIKGGGSLTVTSVYKHAICSDDKIKIEEGTLVLTAVGDGIHANDGVVVEDGSITITAEGDGIQSEDYVDIQGGEINVTTTGEVEQSGGFGGGMPGGGFGGGPNGNSSDTTDDGTAQGNPPEMPSGDMQGNPPEMPNGDMQGNPPEMPDNNTQSDGQSTDEATTEDESSLPSTKGIKAETNLIVGGGTITVNSADHALHCAGIALISGGTLNLSSEHGKGISTHVELAIEGGEINVLKSTEGIESKGLLYVNGGNIYVKASDDGFNAGGTDGRDVGDNDTTHRLYINGGSIYVDADGDGLDSNGLMSVSGGTVIVNGPTNDGNGALDSGGSIAVSGGTLVASGSSGMAEYPSGEASTQPSIIYTADQALEADTLIHIEDSDGNEIVTFRSPKKFQSVVFSSPLLEQGKEYTLYTGGEYSGESTASGLLTGGTYSGGTLVQTFTLDSMSTSVGAAAFGQGGGNPGGGMGGGPGGGPGGGGMRGGGRGGMRGGMRGGDQAGQTQEQQS